MSYQRNSGPGPIPSRWLKCPRKSESFIAGKFVAFKTPLSQRFDEQVADEYSFYPNMLFQIVKDCYKAKIGLWIDLTNTSRFYDRLDVERKDCQFVKLKCRGFGETPSMEQTKSFMEIVDTFIKDKPLEMIGVHCTHGFNRTGFLIVSWMVEKMDHDVGAALQIFAQARPPGIYKAEYITELFKRYQDEEDTIPPPALPEWCFEEEEHEDDFGFAGSSSQNNESDKATNKRVATEDGDDTEEPNKKKRRSENIRLDAVFMEGVTGITLMTEKRAVNLLQQMIQNMTKFKQGGFPGAQPVTLDRKNISLLRTKPYRVSWKADGTRYMMLIKQESEIYFFDRDNSCFQVEQLVFPSLKDINTHITNTLLDGEMVLDRHNGKTIPRFLVYDIICLENEDVSKMHFDDRLKCIEKNIIYPRNEATKRGLLDRTREPFSIRAKQFWEVTTAAALLGEKFAKSLAHEPDGLIFQPKNEPYVGGRCDDILKWKPADQNSVDFKLKIVEESGVGILTRKTGCLFVGSLDTPFAHMKYTKMLKDLNNKIIECKYENNQWVFMRERTDKSYPNSYTTAVSVCDSIKQPVTKEILLDFIDNKRFREEHDNK